MGGFFLAQEYSPRFLGRSRGPFFCLMPAPPPPPDAQRLGIKMIDLIPRCPFFVACGSVYLR